MAMMRWRDDGPKLPAWAWPAIGLLPLTACGDQTSTLATVEADRRATRNDAGEIICARRGSDDFRRDCSLDRTSTAEGLVLTVRHSDGAFHRLLVTGDGRGVIAADGAERAEVRILGADEIEVSLAGDRYRLPATIRAPSRP